MPSFLGRRYQRDSVGPIEKLIGALLLALLAAIVLCVVLTVARNRDYLFTVPDEYLADPAGPRTELLTGQLLPPADPQGSWQLDESSRQAGPDEQGRTIFQATYRSGGDDKARADVRVIEFPDAASAQQAFQSARPADFAPAESILLSLTGQTRLGMADYVARGKVGFWSGRYYTELDYDHDHPAAAVGLAAALAGRQLSYGPAPLAAASAPQPGQTRRPTEPRAGPLPTIDQAPWQGPDAVRVFGPANLYEKINGRAGIYLSFGFVKLTFGTYRHARQRPLYVDCYVYDMGTVENAFGIFKAEQSPDAELLEIGREGYSAGDSIFFWKGGYYVQLLAPGYDDEYSKFIPVLAAMLADGLDDDGSKLWADVILPAAGRVAGSFAFLKSDAFGLDFLNDVYVADYRAAERTWSVFIHRAAGSGQARAIVAKYSEHLGKYGKVLERRDDFVLGQVGGFYEALAAHGRYVCGVNACDDRQFCQTQVAALAQAVKE